MSAKLVIDGQITLGMMMAISSIVGNLNGPVLQLIGFIREVQDAKISLSRLSEIHEKEDEAQQEETQTNDIPLESDIALKDVSFSSSNSKYTNFFTSSLNNIEIIDSDFSNSIFTESKIKNISLYNSTFNEAEFIRTNLKDVDFSTCNIERIVFDIDSLKGIKINALQASDIISLFGVQIK